MHTSCRGRYIVAWRSASTPRFRENPESANPRRNFTEMLHVLGEHTGMKTELYQTNIKSQGLSIEPRSSTGCID